MSRCRSTATFMAPLVLFVVVSGLAPPAIAAEHPTSRAMIRSSMHATTEVDSGRRFPPVGPRHTIGDGAGGAITAQVAMPDPSADGHGNLVLNSTTRRPSATFTVRASGGYVTRIGGFRPRTDPTIAAAERVFGPASSRDLGKYNDCRVTWSALRLRINFANFGGHGPGETTCTPSVGRSQSFSVRGSRFRTWKGLRVGQRSKAIRKRHPGAEFRRNTWWLKTAVSPFGDNSEYPVVSAIVARKRVKAIAGWIGAAGE